MNCTILLKTNFYLHSKLGIKNSNRKCNFVYSAIRSKTKKIHLTSLLRNKIYILKVKSM